MPKTFANGKTVFVARFKTVRYYLFWCWWPVYGQSANFAPWLLNFIMVVTKNLMWHFIFPIIMDDHTNQFTRIKKKSISIKKRGCGGWEEIQSTWSQQNGGHFSTRFAYPRGMMMKKNSKLPWVTYFSLQNNKSFFIHRWFGPNESNSTF
jgi:hypothetical protein